MPHSAHFSSYAPIFRGRKVPEEGAITGYGAIIEKLGLKIPVPGQIALICQQNKKYQTENWNVLPKSYLPDDNKNLTEVEALLYCNVPRLFYY